METQHDRPREGPWLAAQVLHVGDGQAHFLGDFAGYARLQRFARLDESGQQREHPLRPELLTAEHRAVTAVVHQADDGGVGAREFFLAGGRIHPNPAALGRSGG